MKEKIVNIGSILLKYERQIWVAFLVFLFLYCATHQAVRFFITGPIFLIFTIAYTIMASKIRFDLPIILYEVGIIWYCVCINELVIQLIVEPVIFYVLFTSVITCRHSCRKDICFISLTVVCGLFLRGVTNWCMLFRYPEGRIIERWPNFLDGTFRVRTNHEFYLLPMGTLLFLSLYLIGQKKKQGFLLLIGIIIANIMAFLTEGRMTPLIGFLVGCLMVVFLLIFRRKELFTPFFAILLILSFIFVIIAVISFAFNLFGMGKMLSYWNGSGGVITNVRFGLDYEQCKLLLKYPMGGCEEDMIISGYDWIFTDAHNLWLQIGRKAGIIPLVLTGGSVICSLVDIVRLFKNKKADALCVILLSSVYFAFIGHYTAEMGALQIVSMFTIHFILVAVIRQYRVESAKGTLDEMKHCGIDYGV